MPKSCSLRAPGRLLSRSWACASEVTSGKPRQVKEVSVHRERRMRQLAACVSGDELTVTTGSGDGGGGQVVGLMTSVSSEGAVKV